MKRLLIGPAIAFPLFLGFCNFGGGVPKAPEVPNFDQRFPVPHLNLPAVPPKEKPNVRRANSPAASPERPRAHGRPRSHKHPERPHHPVAPVVKEEPLPPQQGPICIFPLNMIPNCKPQEIQ